ncbi:hypothetical protein ACFO0O_00615 [Cobetia amphilecti]|uniref:Uncharacterized protein n=1 Tax=Cobetia amphilecti TaxID=1055104 RepID=A0ABT6UVK1_9GAMM|nr:hypothetical protein [Cobetia amphilecti]MDI5886078.1 hypothetical protein [Cobetia amphilecti]
MQQIEHMGLVATFRLIEHLPEGERRRRALVHALDELLEEEIEWRTGLRHQNAGWHKVSSVGGAGEGRGDCTGLVDHVGMAAERYREESQWRTMAAALLSRLSERHRLAVLLSAYAVRPVQHCQSSRMMTHAQLVQAQVGVAARLGWTPGAVAVEPFPTVKALQRAADKGRQQLLEVVAAQAEMLA